MLGQAVMRHPSLEGCEGWGQTAYVLQVSWSLGHSKVRFLVLTSS